ncbi:alanine--tRNA ligase [Suttonella sp. R2A3]|uniref:alanine--tRNA ligase n=1 Tax=Suttonella sp. R2A3 TaxID=2908648 RepID=UPI001F025B9D|nr:alanine--tRNA ligase [Suttonella sp. R2A3]UJF25415.1 alanine--tRNA ligase [Suttonella sp. R2A3]
MTTKPITTTADIRRTFIEFFADRGHKAVHSASLVPGNDPTLLFTNAGMVPFKDVFTGLEVRDYQRAVSAQRCVRAGGKHNDLENVGYTARHHTFFEMMGNFSFGDYFKAEAIRYAWDLITKVYGLPEEKLWVTVYADDDEAFNIWRDDIGVPVERIVRIGDKSGKARYESDNFWAMGDTGPCGPCSEIFYDHGPDVWGGPPGSPDEDGDRYIEIWNLVFMQFERDISGTMKPLPKPSIDTGMGLERMAAVMQHVHSNYEIDIFQALISAAAQATGYDDKTHNSLKVIADHIRSTVFLMVDGVLPGKEGRDYVLRRIMRRAIRHGHKLGQKQPFFHQLVRTVVSEMGEAYPEIIKAEQRITQAVLREEERFARTLDDGMGVLEKALEGLSGETIDGETVFKLYDTYGFPVDLTADIARERGLALDMAGYEQAMQVQRETAKAAGKFKAGKALATHGKTAFAGYDETHLDAQVQQIFVDDEEAPALNEGQQGVVVLNSTPFYGESGGQVGDIGVLRCAEGDFCVEDTQKQGDTYLHYGYMQQGSLSCGAQVGAEIDATRRTAIKRHHSATHLLHKALREVLGDHVQQKGSLVNERVTRFDFAHDGIVSAEQLHEIEQRINTQVLYDVPVTIEELSIDEAKAKGAMALFGEKYGDVVRVISMGEDNYSIELCGGTHVARTGEIGMVKIISQSSVSAGVRRIEATAGLVTLKQMQDDEALTMQASAALKTDPAHLPERIEQLQQQLKVLEKETQQLKRQLASGGSSAEIDVQEAAGWRYIALQRDGLDNATLRDSADQLRDKHQVDLVVLGSAEEETARLVASVAKNAQGLHAGQLIKTLATYIDGKGGGRPDFAQAGGKNPAALSDALAAVADVLKQEG